MHTQGFLDLSETDSPPAATEAGVAEAIASVGPRTSLRAENIKFGSTPVAAGACVKILDVDPSRARAGVSVAAVDAAVTVSTLVYVSDRWVDPASAGGLRYIEGAQLPNDSATYLVLETTSALYVTVPATATAPAYVSFWAESYSAA